MSTPYIWVSATVKVTGLLCLLVIEHFHYIWVKVWKCLKKCEFLMSFRKNMSWNKFWKSFDDHFMQFHRLLSWIPHNFDVVTCKIAYQSWTRKKVLIQRWKPNFSKFGSFMLESAHSELVLSKTALITPLHFKVLNSANSATITAFQLWNSLNQL